MTGTGFFDGERVTYLAPQAGLFQTEDVETDHILSFDLSTIYIPGNTLNTGDPVVYEVQEGGTPLSGLTPGDTYYVIQNNPGYVLLSDSHTDALLGSGIVEFSAGSSSAGTEQALVPPSIGGLTNGDTYIVTSTPSGSFTIENTNGSPVNMNGSGAGGTHEFISDGIQLTPGTGTQALVIVLSQSIASPTQDALYSPDGVSLRLLSPPGTGISSAEAEGGSGGAINVDEPDAQTYSGITVEAYDDAALLQAGGNVSILGLSTNNTNSSASNDGGGVISIQQSEADDEFADMTAAFVGSGDPFSGSVSASGVSIVAANQFVLHADSQFTADLYSSSDGGGFVADTEGTSTAEDGSDDSSNILGNTTDAVVGSGATISGKTALIEATNSVAVLNVSANASGGGFAGSNSATANGEVTSVSNVNINSAATISGFSGVDVIAFNSDYVPNLDADATGFYLFGPPNSSDNNYSDTLNAFVDSDLTATVIAGPRPEDTPLTPAGSLPFLALYVEANSGFSVSNGDEQTCDVYWDANVTILSGADVDLVIDPTGKIVTDENVTVTDGEGGPTLGVGDTISSGLAVVPYISPSMGQVEIYGSGSQGTSSTEGVSNGSAAYPTFTFFNTFSSVTITNESANDLEIQGIDVATTTINAPTVRASRRVRTIPTFRSTSTSCRVRCRLWWTSRTPTRRRRHQPTSI